MIYTVTDKATGAEVYRYASEAPIEWSGMGFDTHDHVELVEIIDGAINVVPTRIFSQVEWLRRFTKEERIAIRAAAAANAELDDFIKLMDATPEIRSDDPDVIKAMGLLEQAGLIGAGRANEVLNG